MPETEKPPAKPVDIYYRRNFENHTEDLTDWFEFEEARNQYIKNSVNVYV